jgi:tripartite ATP-independent transporter DctM subunit
MGMSSAALAIAAILMLAAFLLGLHVASTLGLLSVTLFAWFSDRPILDLLGLIAWNANTSFVLVAIPLFILMGEILLHSGLSERLYRGLSAWLSALPGGLLHTNIAACATFAAVSGSSVATAATIGSIALPALRARGYDDRIVAGSLAAGGTLGILIPPSINFIVYGVLMEVSIGRLYMAGVLPGVMLSLLFMAWIFLVGLVRPNIAPREAAAVWRLRLTALVEMIPIGILVFLVLGTIYLGVATPTEAAAFGVLGALALAFWGGGLSRAMLKRVFRATACTTAMVMLILTGAFILNSTLAFLGVPQALTRTVAAWNLTPVELILILVGFYLVLGTFMDGFAMMVTTIPVVLPLLKAMNIDLVWFGVIAVILTEAALISPPEGLNLYVIHGVRKAGGGRSGTILDVWIGVLPFFLIMLLAIGLIIAFPEIATWLPTTMRGK